MIIIQIINFVSITYACIAQFAEMLSTTPATDETSINEVTIPNWNTLWDTLWNTLLGYFADHGYNDDDLHHETTTYYENIVITSTATPYEKDIEQHMRKSKT